MRLSKESQQSPENLSNADKLEQEKIQELESILPDMPRFEGFFNSQSKGKHPFEEDQFQFTEQLDADEVKAQQDFDEELQKRELEGRLIGETLTPRQFGLLYKAKMDQGSQVKFMKDNEHKQFIENRDSVRIMEEQKEAARRRMVLSG